MKQFSCGDVVPGCTAIFRYKTDDAIFNAVATHARSEHGLAIVPDSLIGLVRDKIRPDQAS